MNKPIQRIPVDSSYIKAIGYDPATKAMHVEFSDGHMHAYDGVTPEQHNYLRMAPSIGAHFHANIKGKFSHRAI